MNKLVVIFIFSLIISSCNNWKPNDDEMENVQFDDYDWQKLKTN